MGKKTLVLLGTLGVLSPIVLQSLVAAILITVLAIVMIVYIVLFNQAANDRLIKLITAITFLLKQKVQNKKN